MAKKKRGRITVLEAVDNLSHLADLDAEKEGAEWTEWTDLAKVEENQDAIRETFKTLTSYLQHLYQKERTELGNPQTQKGLQAMMQLAGEAVDKVGKYTKLFKGAHREAIPEFQQLQQFYLSKVFSRVKQEKAAESWESEGEEGELEYERQALKDLEAVQQDDEYELFYISKEDGTPFFTPQLLRHIRMVGNFDESLISKDREDMLRRMEVILDRDLHVSAQEILQEATDLIDRFYKEALHHREQEGPAALCSAVMALMLSANPKNLMHNSYGKSSDDYFIDFEMYLRKVLETGDYNQWRTTALEKLSSFKTVCLKLTHYLCNALFLRSGARVVSGRRRIGASGARDGARHDHRPYGSRAARRDRDCHEHRNGRRSEQCCRLTRSLRRERSPAGSVQGRRVAVGVSDRRSRRSASGGRHPGRRGFHAWTIGG